MAVFQNLIRWLGGGATRQPGLQSGEPQTGRLTTVPVNSDTALQLSAVWASVRLLSETVAGLPLRFYRLDGDVRTEAINYPLAELLSGKPNRYQTRIEFFETMTMQLALHGNAYALISRTGNRITALLPLMSTQMTVDLLLDGAVSYHYNDGRVLRVFAEQSIWHVKLLGNGIIGLSPMDHARNSIGIGIAEERRVGEMADNGFKPAGLLMIDKLLKPDQRAQIKAQFSDLVVGQDEPLKVLEAGMKYQQISIAPKDLQLLEARRFQLEDVARFFGVPSVLINDTAATTNWGSGIQQIIQGFYKFGVRPYLERYEASIKNTLVPVADRREIDPEFDFRALLRGDDATITEMLTKAVQGGIKTPNEARAEIGKGPLTGGDTLFMQQQMVPIERLGNEPAQVTQD